MTDSDRLIQARDFVHDRTCPIRYEHEAATCLSAPRMGPLAAALAHLDAHPRDARGARRIFHDAACLSDCGPESDHADRTQSGKAVALRKFRANEGEQ